MNHQQKRIMLLLVITITATATITTNQLALAEIPDKDLADQTIFAAMKAAGLMKQVTSIVDLCSYMVYDADYMNKCLTFTQKYTEAVQNVIDNYNPENQITPKTPTQ